MSLNLLFKDSSRDFLQPFVLRKHYFIHFLKYVDFRVFNVVFVKIPPYDLLNRHIEGGESLIYIWIPITEKIQHSFPYSATRPISPSLFSNLFVQNYVAHQLRYNLQIRSILTHKWPNFMALNTEIHLHWKFKEQLGIFSHKSFVPSFDLIPRGLYFPVHLSY